MCVNLSCSGRCSSRDRPTQAHCLCCGVRHVELFIYYWAYSETFQSYARMYGICTNYIDTHDLYRRARHSNMCGTTSSTATFLNKSAITPPSPPAGQSLRRGDTMERSTHRTSLWENHLRSGQPALLTPNCFCPRHGHQTTRRQRVRIARVAS